MLHTGTTQDFDGRNGRGHTTCDTDAPAAYHVVVAR